MEEVVADVRAEAGATEEVADVRAEEISDNFLL
jgi:hypothetical protein